MIDASKEQGLLMEHVAKENIPFLKVLALTNSNRGVDFYQMSLSIALKRDQKSRKKDMTTYYDPEELYTKTIKTITEQSLIEDSCTSSFKDLLIQECQVARKELKILSGENISKLFEEAQSEEERFWIMKAYYNLSRQYFKDTSGYFKNPQDAQMYIYLTANKEINQMILDRRIKRKN